MARVIFPKGKQTIWINRMLKGANLDVNEAAKICEVSARTFRDWRRQRFNISKRALLKLSKDLDISLPPNTRFVPDFWYVSKGARKGALKRLDLYGPLGDRESRRKGGLVSQKRRRQNSEKYRLLGCNVRKNFRQLMKSEQFAEVAGIILGDGGITDSQLRVYLGKELDEEYAVFVRKLFKRIFGEQPARYEYKNVIVLCLSGVDLIENLAKWGLSKGNKVQRQVDFPKWIWEESRFQKACVRGLIDTDGGVYFHNHKIKGTKYTHLGLCFTSWSKPLLSSVSEVLKKFLIKHSVTSGRIYLYDLEEVKKYFRIFEPNNPKHRSRLNSHLSNRRELS